MKTLAKFDIDRACGAMQWIEAVLGRRLEPPSDDIQEQLDVRDALRDGIALCEVMNTFHPGAIRKINNSKFPFKQMENIEQFLLACRDFGMKEVDVFQTQDLYEAKSMYTVINCLYQLSALARKHGYDGPTIGVKLADENRRSFTAEQVQQGKMAISLQYGSPEGASQRGMTPYGMTRKM